VADVSASRVGQNARMRVTYDADADAACIYVTDERLMPGRQSVPVDPPDGLQAFVALDEGWQVHRT